MIISVFSLYSCKQENHEKEILGKEEFARMLVDMYVAEARLNSTPVKRDSAMKLFIPFEKSLLAKSKITDEKLKDTYRYYLEHPAEFEKITQLTVQLCETGVTVKLIRIMNPGRLKCVGCDRGNRECPSGGTPVDLSGL